MLLVNCMKYRVPRSVLKTYLLLALFAYHAVVLADVQPPENWKDEPIWPLPLTVNLDLAKVALGEKLFHDPRLSHDNTISCASCHNLMLGGVDGLAKSVGINATLGDINAPTVLNSSLNFVQFWDGRAASLEEQAAGPINNPAEMGSNWQEVLSKLNEDSAFVSKFKESYSEGLSPETITHAIAEFERSLITSNNRFDQFLRGDASAITMLEAEGYQLFKDIGCASCHQGKAVGGNMFEKMGIVRDYFASKRVISKSDLGRFNVTSDPEDKHEFKVPSLRNVALTAPYFHDASASTLETAVVMMARFQLGRDLTQIEMEKIVAFLKTLSGELEVIK